METIAQKLEKVINSKSEIKESIESYGVEVDDAPLNEYPQKIDTIEELHPDINWIMEAKVGNHPVVTAADMRKILSYIAQDYGGYSILRTAPITSVDLSEVTSIGAYGLAIAFGTNSTLTSATFTSLTTINKERALQSAFTACIGLASVSFPALETVSGAYVMYQMCYNDTALTSVSFPVLASITGTYAMSQMCMGSFISGNMSFPSLTTCKGSYVLNEAFRNSKITSLSFPELTDIASSYTEQYGAYYLCENNKSLVSVSFPKLKRAAAYSFRYAFQNCTNLEVADFSNFDSNYTTSIAMFRDAFRGCTKLHTFKWGALTTPSNNGFIDMFYGCSALKTLYCKANALRVSPTNANAFQYPLTYLTMVYLTTNANDNVYLTRQANLTADAVKNVLEHCDNANMGSGKSISFYTDGLTVTDDADGSLAALKTSITARGCTINNLTINPYTA